MECQVRSCVSVDKKENSLRGNVDYGNATPLLNISYKEVPAKEMLTFQIVSYKIQNANCTLFY